MPTPTFAAALAALNPEQREVFFGFTTMASMICAEDGLPELAAVWSAASEVVVGTADETQVCDRFARLEPALRLLFHGFLSAAHDRSTERGHGPTTNNVYKALSALAWETV